MPIPSNSSTWDVNPSTDTVRRAGQYDILNAVKADDTYFPPNVITDPCADEYNQLAFQAAALNKTIPSLIVSVAFSAVSPYAPYITYYSSPSNNLSISNVTVSRTSGGAATGDTTIAWTSGLLPIPVAGPTVSVNDYVPRISCVFAHSSTSVRAITQDHSGSAVDAPYTVVIY